MEADRTGEARTVPTHTLPCSHPALTHTHSCTLTHARRFEFGSHSAESFPCAAQEITQDFSEFVTFAPREVRRLAAVAVDGGAPLRCCVDSAAPVG